MTLEEWLTANCGYLELAVRDLPAKADLPPFFAAIKDDMPLIFGIDLMQFDKTVAVQLFQAGLKAMGAEKYAIIAAAWYVKVNIDDAAVVEVIDREGIAGAYKDQRRECYQVTVGDHERSLIAIYDVERDWKGKIRRLTLQKKGAAKSMIGRMVDLLVERTMH
jgi:hypothetical protein